MQKMILITCQNKIMRHQLESRFRNSEENRNANGYPIGDTQIMRQIQLEKDS